jgi:glycosyltransferase involved in cell wall biosynthesis
VTSGHDPIRILRVIARLNVGGPALHVSHLSRELDQRGYETTLVAGRVGQGEGSMEYFAEELGVQPLYVSELQREISAAPDAFAVHRLVQLIRQFRPDILHTHTAKAGAVGRAAAMLAGSARPPVVVHTFHGHVLRGYFTPNRARVFQQIERILAHYSDALIAVSPQVRDDLVGLGVAPAGKIAVIRLGLDLERRVATDPAARAVVRGKLAVPEESFLIGWLGRMTEIKRANDLLTAFARLRKRGVDAHLALVGDGPLRGALEEFAAELGVSDRTRFVGFRESVGEFYSAFDAVALTSANEGTPVTVIEALASGLPVVATDVGGVADVVRDGRSGFLVAARDVGAIAERLEELAQDPELRTRMGQEGCRYVVPRYSVPRLVEDVDRLYRTLLQQRQPTTRLVLTAIDRPLTPALPTHRPAVRSAGRKLRVILLSQYFPPEVGATQSRAQSFAEYLAAQGHSVTVICEFPNHPHGVIPEIYRGRLYQDDRSNPYRVLRVRVLATQEKTQFTRMQFYLSYMTLAAAIAPLAGRADVVFATSPPLFTGVAGLAVARFNRAPLVLDIRDLWPAAAVSLRQMGEGVPLRIAERLEMFLYREAAAVTAVTRPFCNRIDEIRARDPQAILLPNGTLESFFVDDDKRERLASPDEFLVTFAGTHGIAQALPSVLDAAERLNGSARFAFVGEGPVKSLLVKETRDRQLSNVDFHAQRSPAMIPGVLRGSDALLVPLSAHPTFAAFVPSKMIDFMAVGRPLIVSAQGEAARILAASGAGLAVPPEDAEALAGAVRWLAANPDEAEEMGRRGRDFARRRLRQAQAQRLEQILLDSAAKHDASRAVRPRH